MALFPRLLARVGQQSTRSFHSISPHSLSSSLSSLTHPAASRHLSVLASSSLPPPPHSPLSPPSFLYATRSFSSSSPLSSSETPENGGEGVEQQQGDAPSEEWNYTPRPEGKVGSQVVVDGELVDVEDLEIADPVVEASESHWYDYPIEGVENVMIQMHDSLDITWVTTIAMATFCVRTVLLPFVVKSSKSSAKLRIMTPELQAVKKKYGKDQAQNMDQRNEIMEIMKKHNVTPFSPFMGMFIQIPIVVTFFVTLRRMASEVPSFTDGGYLWFTDLSIPDPDGLLRLPLLASFTTLMAMELSFSMNKAQNAQSSQMQGMMKNFMRGFSLFFIFMTSSFPQAIHVYWISTNCYTLVQTALIHNKKFKDFIGIPDTTHIEELMKQGDKKPIRYAYDPERLSRKGKKKED